ncbi:unnamed protein product [Acanthoscelides obtectus]|uniref:Uncharacterized protein n=1 Tax=Acanthoscelides obtectus TaxID=200917 RepID=A0A9P0Q7Z3_ACAOB|nr:unnamed protein product [Acanthoscelides obtectus]CAK1631797.1 hypothetical protein AOBTE_LOCUS7169 [Acanthoscelides obtectus]
MPHCQKHNGLGIMTYMFSLGPPVVPI